MKCDLAALMGLVTVILLALWGYVILIMPLRERDADSYDPRWEQDWSNEPNYEHAIRQ